MERAWTFHNAGKIIFGNGALHNINNLLRQQKVRKVAVITDIGLKRAGLLSKLLSILERSNLQVFVYDKAIPEPTLKSTRECFLEIQRFEPELFIALGGGSCMDLSKITSLLITHGGEVPDYYGENKVPGKIRPIISIPTTAGTGSEISSVAIVTDEKTGLKIGISDNFLRSTVVLYDPELTLNLPPQITACTGIDALSQAIEAYFAKNYKFVKAEEDLIYQGSNPLSDIFAERAIQIIGKNIVPAVQQGDNLEFRSNMLLGNLYSAIAFSNSGTSLIHALAYPIARKVNKAHGVIIGILLPYVMKYNAAVLPNRFEKIAELFGVNHLDSQYSKIQQGIEVIFRILENIELPTKLSQIGIGHEDLTEIVETTLTIERLIRLNPRTPSKEQIHELLESAL
jgi:alcohol dehydrogenase